MQKIIFNAIGTQTDRLIRKNLNIPNSQFYLKKKSCALNLFYRTISVDLFSKGRLYNKLVITYIIIIIATYGIMIIHF